MNSLKASPLYKEAFNELNYPFGNYFLFEGFIVAEINEDIVYNWENHGKLVAEDVSNLYDHNGKDLIYITNRINNYSVKPTDWIKFYKHHYNLKAYAIVSYSEKGIKNAILEKLFMSTKINRFISLDSAIEWAKKEREVKESA